jgi:hypothetical protein
MLRLLPTRLQQLRMVVADVEPLGLLVLVRLYQFVHQVLVSSVFPHLDANSSDYSRIVGTGLRLQPEELPKQNPVGLDTHKLNASQKGTKTEMWKTLLGFRFRYSMS